MKFHKWLENWDMTSLKIKTPILDMEWEPQEKDKDAAWELYIEMMTRTATQWLQPEYGSEKAALQSIYQLFDLTRTIIKKYGRDCIEFTKVAIPVLNQVVRPFTTKWHKISVENGFDSAEKCIEFRKELKDLQGMLRKYTKMLSDLAGVEDINGLDAE